jgi:hypothetical protein
MTTTETTSEQDWQEPDLTAWRDATRPLAVEWQATAYTEALERIRQEREGKVKRESVITETQRAKARRIAKGVVTEQLYWLEEAPDGTPNPFRNDPVWGWGDQRPAAEPEDIEGLVAWLAEQTWSEFALSLASQYRQRGSLSSRQLEAARSMRQKSEQRAQERQARADAEAAAPDTGIDLSGLPAGLYAVPGGDTRLKVRIDHGKNRWEGWTFVKDGAEYGQQRRYGVQKPGETYRGDIEDALRAILADPYAAACAYGQLVGRCGMCGSLLENQDSIEAGIGPICARKFAA